MKLSLSLSSVKILCVDFLGLLFEVDLEAYCCGMDAPLAHSKLSKELETKS